MKRYKYKHKHILPLIKTILGSVLMIWLTLFLFPSIYHAQTGKELFPPEPEDIEETYQIIEPAVLSTKMLEAEEESREQAEAKAEVLTETQYIAMTLEVAAYAPLDNKSGMCADDTPLKTSTGKFPQRGTVAINPEIFEYGTEFYIPGYGFGVAEDTGAYVRKHTDKIEVFMDTHEECMAWGRRTLPVFIKIDKGA